jgi:hypothetical protein
MSGQKVEVGSGKRAGLSSDDAQKMKALERENRKLRACDLISNSQNKRKSPTPLGRRSTMGPEHWLETGAYGTNRPMTTMRFTHTILRYISVDCDTMQVY